MATSTGQFYRFDPYDPRYSRVFLAQPLGLLSPRSSTTDTMSLGESSCETVSTGHTSSDTCSPVRQRGLRRFVRLPKGTLHGSLNRLVEFIPYPTVAVEKPEATLPKEQMVRVFIGQLPYQVTDMQLDWLCNKFGNRVPVYYPERITKNDRTAGKKVPTGCVHAYCHPDRVDALTAGLHKRLLVDDTGVWYANNLTEQRALSDYCNSMQEDRRKRYHHRPYDTVVAQYATSRFHASHCRPLPFPESSRSAKSQQ